MVDRLLGVENKRPRDPLGRKVVTALLVVEDPKKVPGPRVIGILLEDGSIRRGSLIVPAVLMSTECGGKAFGT